MTITLAASKRRAEVREEETTRVYRKLTPPEPSKVLLLPNPPVRYQDIYHLAPSPWPRGQFQIDPEG